MENCYICNTSELGSFGKPQGIETTYLLCKVHYREWRKSYQKFRSNYRLDNHVDPYKDEELIEGETYPAGCYLCGTLKNHSDFEAYSQHYKCPDCLRMVKRFCDDWMRENRIPVLIEEVFCSHCGCRIIKPFQKAPDGLFGNMLTCPSHLCKKEFMVNCSTIRDKDKPSLVNIKEVFSRGDIDDKQTTLSEFYDKQEVKPT